MASPTSSATSAEPRKRRWYQVSALELGIVVAIVGGLAVFGADSYLAEIPLRLAFGWYDFMQMNAEVMQPKAFLVAEAMVCTIALAIGAHYFCRWLRADWRVRWTVTGLAGVLLLFVAGIATIGITHQTAWLFTAKGPMIIDSWGPRFVLPEVIQSAAPAREAVAAHFARTGRLPASAKEAGVDDSQLVTSKHVKALRVEDDGLVVIELQHKQAPDGLILFTPTVRGGGLDWKCSSNLERIHLPAECRK